MPVFLTTDVLLYLLLAAVAAFIFYARRKKYLRDPWLRVFRRRSGMIALVILSAYVAVGVLDSIHFRPVAGYGPQGQAHYAPQVISVLDWIATPLRKHTEKTYSAPFATRLFVKETVPGPNGKERRIYPRLKWAGAGLAHPRRQELGNVLYLGGVGAVEGLAAAALLTLLLAWRLARRRQQRWLTMLVRVLRARTDIPWRAGLLTAAGVLVFVFMCANLAPHYHLLGTDKVGQDVFFEAIKSIRTGLLIGTLTTLVMLPFALLLGVMAGYLRGWVDDAIQYLYTTLSSIPGVLLIAAAVLMLQVYMENHPGLFATTAARADLRLLFLCIILGITSWTSLCRLLRGEALKLREADYVVAAVGLGVSRLRVMTRHLLPNMMHIVLIQVVLDFSGLVLAEAVLTYVGVGVDPTMNSWGNMINGARLELARDPVVWWPLLAAFLFMSVLVLAANVFADAVRDAFDPRLRSGTV